MRDHIYIGCVPNDEKGVAIGITPNAAALSRVECHFYRKALIKHYGPTPGNVVLACKANPHDFGTYYSLEAYFDYKDNDTTEVDYCFRLEEGLDVWPEDIKKELHDHIKQVFKVDYQQLLNNLA